MIGLASQQPLRSVLSSFANRRFVLVRPGGNWGDDLIYLGAEHLASELGLTWRSLEYDEFISNDVDANEVIYLHGSGGFTSWGSGKAQRCFAKALQTPGAFVIQGPCTLADDQALHLVERELRTIRAEQAFFFARETSSAEIGAKILPPEIRQFLNEDTALYLNHDLLLNRVGRPRRRTDLVAVREDPEGIGVNASPAKSRSVIDPAYFARSFDHWIRIHAASRTIVTNRTHSAICGAILGIPTTMFAGSYHKNRSIWEFSLSKRGVMWVSNCDAIPTRAVVDPFLAWIPVPYIRQSWRLDRIAKCLRGIPLS